MKYKPLRSLYFIVVLIETTAAKMQLFCHR
jgi:hypothetical protein